MQVLLECLGLLLRLELEHKLLVVIIRENKPGTGVSATGCFGSLSRGDLGEGGAEWKDGL